MKRLFPLFSALAAVPFVALLLVSLGYTLGEASLLAVMFLPGLFAFRHFLPQIRFAERRRGALQLFPKSTLPVVISGTTADLAVSPSMISSPSSTSP